MTRTNAEAGALRPARPEAEKPALDLFLRVMGVTAALFMSVGAVWGFVRGLAYPPTVAFAVVEGALLFLIPGMVLAVLTGLGAVLWRLLPRRG
jgi:hypothetical protein